VGTLCRPVAERPTAFKFGTVYLKDFSKILSLVFEIGCRLILELIRQF
jgi:hypothetical protein